MNGEFEAQVAKFRTAADDAARWVDAARQQFASVAMELDAAVQVISATAIRSRILRRSGDGDP